MSVNLRLKEVLKIKELNIKQFSEQLEMPYRTVQNYLLNERNPKAEALVKISQKMNVNLNWLLLNEGDMFKNSINENKLTEQETKLIENYRLMTYEVKEAFDTSFEAVPKK